METSPRTYLYFWSSGTKIPLKTDGSTVRGGGHLFTKILDSLGNPVDRKIKSVPTYSCNFTLYTKIDARKGAIRAIQRTYVRATFLFSFYYRTGMMQQHKVYNLTLTKIRQRVQRIIKVKGGRQGRPPFTLSESPLRRSRLCLREWHKILYKKHFPLDIATTVP